MKNMTNLVTNVSYVFNINIFITQKNSFQNKNQIIQLGKRRKKAFLDLMLDFNENDKAPMTDEEIREQVETFMFAVS